MIYKEETRRGHGPCASLKWARDNDESFLFAGFGNGRVTSYSLKYSDPTQFYPVSKIHIGSPVSYAMLLLY